MEAAQKPSQKTLAALGRNLLGFVNEPKFKRLSRNVQGAVLESVMRTLASRLGPKQCEKVLDYAYPEIRLESPIPYAAINAYRQKFIAIHKPTERNAYFYGGLLVEYLEKAKYPGPTIALTVMEEAKKIKKPKVQIKFLEGASDGANKGSFEEAKLYTAYYRGCLDLKPNDSLAEKELIHWMKKESKFMMKTDTLAENIFGRVQQAPLPGAFVIVMNAFCRQHRIADLTSTLTATAAA